MPNLPLFEISLNFEPPPAFENAARYPNSETKVQRCDDRRMRRLTLVKLGSRIPENRWAECLTPKIAWGNVLNRK